MLTDSRDSAGRVGRYDARRSLCIRFLSRDRSGDDVIWLQVAMRVSCGDGGATVVCWNQVVDRLQALELIRREDAEEDHEDAEEAADREQRRQRPSVVVEMERREGLERRGRRMTATTAGGQLGRSIAGVGASGGAMYRAPAESPASDSAGCDERHATDRSANDRRRRRRCRNSSSPPPQNYDHSSAGRDGEDTDEVDATSESPPCFRRRRRGNLHVNTTSGAGGGGGARSGDAYHHHDHLSFRSSSHDDFQPDTAAAVMTANREELASQVDVYESSAFPLCTPLEIGVVPVSTLMTTPSPPMRRHIRHAEPCRRHHCGGGFNSWSDCPVHDVTSSSDGHCRRCSETWSMMLPTLNPQDVEATFASMKYRCDSDGLLK